MSDDHEDPALEMNYGIPQAFIGSLCYRGNTVSYIYDKTACYKDQVSMAFEALRALGWDETGHSDNDARRAALRAFVKSVKAAARTEPPAEPAPAAPADPHHPETASPASAAWSPSQELVNDLVQTCQLLLERLQRVHLIQQSEAVLSARLLDRLECHARTLDPLVSESAPQSAPSKTESEPSQSAKEDEIRAALSRIFWTGFDAANLNLADGSLRRSREAAIQNFLARKGIHV